MVIAQDMLKITGAVDTSLVLNVISHEVAVNSDLFPEYGGNRRANHCGGDFFLFVRNRRMGAAIIKVD